VRDLVDRYKTVWVITGTLYEDDTTPQLPNAGDDHTVLSGFWKIVLVESDGQIKAAGFIFAQGTV
jgi:DNA/RNA endonuclease G (NUC1)